MHENSKGNPLTGQTVEKVEHDEFKTNFSFMGSLGNLGSLGVHKKSDSHFCGSVLISKRHVLTASHCLKSKHFNSTMVTFGSTNLNYGLSYEVKSWTSYKSWAIHHFERYSEFLYYDDIGIITVF